MNELTKRKLRLMRAALTHATAKYTAGGSLRTQCKPKPVTLAKLDHDLQVVRGSPEKDGGSDPQDNT